jgi:hypothetical protein
MQNVVDLNDYRSSRELATKQLATKVAGQIREGLGVDQCETLMLEALREVLVATVLKVAEVEKKPVRALELLNLFALRFEGTYQQLVWRCVEIQEEPDGDNLA